ncbi:MAG: hypothetical protein AAB893_00655 [Patescibacteria group bacterium]
MKKSSTQRNQVISKKESGIKIVVITGDNFEEALITYKRKIAFENIEKFRKKVKLRISMKEFRKLRAYGRQE